MKTSKENNSLNKTLSPQKPRNKKKSTYSKTIKTVDDLLRNIELRNKCKAILGWGHDLIPNHLYKYETDERNEEVVMLLEDFGILKADWTGLENNQKHRSLGNRLITIVVDGSKAIEFFNRMSGKKVKISKTVLELVAHQLADGKNTDEFFELLESCGIPKSLFQYEENYPIENEWLIAYDILKLYASSPKPDDLEVVFRIMEKAAQPIMFGGDEEKSQEFQDKISGYLQYDGCCFDDGKIIKTTEEIMKEIRARLKKTGAKINGELDRMKINLSERKISFDDNRAMITAGDLECPLPPYKNEHFFCRAMFQFLPKEPIDWSIIYVKMENREPSDKEKNSRSILDTMYAVNNRVKEILNTDDKLFTWKEKSIARNY